MKSLKARQKYRNITSSNKLFQSYVRVTGARCSLRVESFESFSLPCEMTIAGIRSVSFTKKRYIPPLQLHKRRGLPPRVGIDPRFGSPPGVASKCVSFGRVTGKSDWEVREAWVSAGEGLSSWMFTWCVPRSQWNVRTTLRSSSHSSAFCPPPPPAVAAAPLFLLLPLVLLGPNKSRRSLAACCKRNNTPLSWLFLRKRYYTMTDFYLLFT